MSDPHSSSKRPTTAKPKAEERTDRMPTNAELLHELRKHGAPPPPPRALPVVSRRTRDYLILASLGSAIIGFAAFRLVSSDATAALRLALTGVGVFCGLLWFVFYGVMSRY
jgi:hypothetical protein